MKRPRDWNCRLKGSTQRITAPRGQEAFQINMRKAARKKAHCCTAFMHQTQQTCVDHRLSKKPAMATSLNCKFHPLRQNNVDSLHVSRHVCRSNARHKLPRMQGVSPIVTYTTNKLKHMRQGPSLRWPDTFLNSRNVNHTRSGRSLMKDCLIFLSLIAASAAATI